MQKTPPPPQQPTDFSCSSFRIESALCRAEELIWLPCEGGEDQNTPTSPPGWFPQSPAHPSSALRVSEEQVCVQRATGRFPEVGPAAGDGGAQRAQPPAEAQGAAGARPPITSHFL